ncbi:TrlF family AAA-like ATPase [Mucilaginibacter jinjuensis]|uniref:Uncharacterized protein n=1 Tax=Mucilaginibacter jinjuensis TaxID=1176721 RepID=A0ABY7TGY0_9SPHI|nr:hypothetical protein [Mucilaginibacter jinjuensis]WCT14422.1 hypothetical protein PQO05_10810 [Mucilaginibacter jinjuensis]
MNQGAKYYRCDFQVHTPRDLQFIGNEYVTEDARKEYSNRFVKACREKHVDAVAITDHHDLAFFNYIKSAAQNEEDDNGLPVDAEKRIIVFPGLELTLDLPCQALILFDADLDINETVKIKIYTALGIQNHNPDSHSKAAQHSRLPFKRINDIYEKLNTIEDLKYRFIVFPNLKENGGDSILREGFHNEYANGVFVGGYLDRGQYNTQSSRVGWNNVVNGKVEAYGFRSMGLFQTSDNRTDTFEHLGVSSTWVKWTEPTAEALRQACLAKKSRILQQEPNLPVTHIQEFKVSGSNFLKDMHLDFNPQFNVAIGGRGTGKSSLLQYISWALGKDIDVPKRADLENFIKNTLNNGLVEITVNKTGIPHYIRRSTSLYEMKIGNADWQSTNSQNVATIIRSDSFSQKELSKHDKDKTNQLNRIIENAVQSDLESIRRKIEENGNKIREVATIYESYLANLKTAKDLKIQITSLTIQIVRLNELLNEMPSEDQVVIKSNTLINEEKNIISISEYQMAQIANQIEHIINNLNFKRPEYKSEAIQNYAAVKTFLNAQDQNLTKIKKGLLYSLQNISSEDSVRYKKALTDLHEEHDERYKEAKERQQTFESTIKEIEELRARLRILTDDRYRITQLIEAEKGVQKELNQLFFARNELNKSLYILFKKAVDDIASKSERTLEIKLSTLTNIEDILGSFIENVTGSKGQPQRTQAFFQGLLNGNNTYKNLLKFWLSLYKKTASTESVDNILAEYGLSNNSLLETDWERISEYFSNSSTIIEFALDLPTYNLELIYCKDDKSKIPFQDASYGQQAGSILTILLNQEFGPLIIDQPEDDLDNKVIHQITENIVAAKHKRQLIFSSHNANIAVNGDAELILVFDHNSDKSAGEVSSFGSIDMDGIKNQVKEIMEGGKVAFEMRKTKYGF